ncbi:WD40 repeat-like protein [Leucogyrophana mollusca]|uniref:WD40 repeat-like protein n=1 Tax=Leucogyrophana mollusca TaxID=85980 RepID=A0ACB8BB08_9AGAM|nr:WD40 repeat-like protein [Leucogyrophana mollusca]
MMISSRTSELRSTASSSATTSSAELGQLCTWIFKGHTGFVSSIAYTPDSLCIVSGSKDNTIRIWNAETGRAVGSPILGHNDQVSAVAITPDGAKIVSGSHDYTVRVWDLKTRDLVHTLEALGYVYSLAISFDNNSRQVIHGSTNRTICMWDLDTGHSIAEQVGELGDTTYFAAAWSADAKKIARSTSDDSVIVSDAANGRLIAGPFQLESHCYSIAVPRGGHQIVCGDGDGRIWIQDSQNSRSAIEPFVAHDSLIWSLAVSSDGKRIVTGSGDDTVCIWDATTSQLIAGPFEDHAGEVYCVDYSPNGKSVASGSGDNTIRVWDVEAAIAEFEEANKSSEPDSTVSNERPEKRPVLSWHLTRHVSILAR